MSVNGSAKYRPFPPVQLPDRQWPQAVITRPPIWLSTDLRDGNQSLFEPMDAVKKLQLFEQLVAMGFKEIEVAFPAASDTDYQFVRQLIEEQRIPDDVTIEVLTPARAPLIERTMQAIRGAKQVIVHVYNATSPLFREVVFRSSPEAVMAMAVDAVHLVKQLAERMPETKVRLQYSPETFSTTELPFAKAVCDAVTAAWQATPARPVIINCPATVEVATPNVYADQIEWMHRHLARRDSVILSVHPHNDRGTAVAATELALMAGAERVEGCLFGHGERTGNVDLVTVALNMLTQGIDPGLDFSDINQIRHCVEACTGIEVHPRHPYAGDLVFTAFSGSHQDAIKKGLAAQSATAPWQVPYLPIDPRDLGRSYDSIIRVNSQSGKGGIAYLLETHYGVVMPRRMQVEFSQVVQRYSDQHGSEVSAQTLWQLFKQHYMAVQQPVQLQDYVLESPPAQAPGQPKRQGLRVQLSVHQQPKQYHGLGHGPVDAMMQVLQQLGAGQGQIRSFEERALGASQSGGEALACAMVECAFDGQVCYGVGIDGHIVTASLQAVIAAYNRCVLQAAATERQTVAALRANELAVLAEVHSLI